ncbi:neutral zinc metallopeptidase [bacterium]|nr:neutral zinc metallopeptidase [bacterium]
MRWEGDRQSENVEDRRRMRPRTVAIGGVGMLVIFLIASFMGIDPQKLQQVINNANVAIPGNVEQEGQERELSPAEVRSRDFVATVVAYTEEVWGEQFKRSGERYAPPKVVLFSDAVQTACGNAPSAVGPFYCPADRTVYLDPTFFDELEQQLGGSKAEFSQAYVIAHEVGHHVQNLLGYSQIVDQKRARSSEAEANRWSVRLELQADYLAGVWAHYGQRKFNFIEPGDVEAAMKSANAIGDDRLQRRSSGFTSPENYTHGTSEQRTRWFNLGLKTGDLSKLKDLFELPYNQL